MTKKGAQATIRFNIEPPVRQTRQPTQATEDLPTPPPYDHLEHTTWWKKWKLQRKKPEAMLINMELENGMFATMLVFAADNGFKFKNKKYLFDDSLKTYNVSSGLYQLDYHENYCLPIQKKLPIQEITKAIAATGISDLEYATNPSVLEKFINSKIAEMVLRGGALDAFMRQIRLLLWVIAIMGLLHLILFVFKSGMLKSIHVPGLF